MDSTALTLALKFARRLLHDELENRHSVITHRAFRLVRKLVWGTQELRVSMAGRTLIIVALVLLALVGLLFWEGYLALDGSDVVFAFQDASMRPAIVLGDSDVFIHDSYAIIAIPLWIAIGGLACLFGLIGLACYIHNPKGKATEQCDEREPE